MYCEYSLDNRDILFWFFWLERQCAPQGFRSLHHHHIFTAESQALGRGGRGENKADRVPWHKEVPISSPLVKKGKLLLKFSFSICHAAMRFGPPGSVEQSRHETQVPHPIPKFYLHITHFFYFNHQSICYFTFLLSTFFFLYC